MPAGGWFRSRPVESSSRSLNHRSNGSRDEENAARAAAKSGVSMYATSWSPAGVLAMYHASLSIPMRRSDTA